MSILDDEVAQAGTDIDLLHQVVHGDANTVVQTQGGAVRSVAKLIQDNQDLFSSLVPSIAGKVDKASANAANGYAGLSGYDIVIMGPDGLTVSTITNLATQSRQYTFPDRDIQVAGLDDVQAVSDRLDQVSGGLTKDAVLAVLQITTISGSNTGDETTQSLTDKLNGVNLLPYTPLDANLVGQTVAPLDGNRLIPAAYLPSSVDEVVTYDTLADFPAAGEKSKIYIDDSTGKDYRWTGSTYFAMISSPGTTDDVPEGTFSEYFTPARVLAVILSGFAEIATGAVNAADNVLQAIGKLQSQITTLFTSLGGKADLASANFTGPVFVPSLSSDDNGPAAANTAFVATAVQSAITTLQNNAATGLTTFGGVSSALGGDANYATTTTTALTARELVANKRVDFSQVDDVGYATVKAVKAYVDNATTNVLVDCGNVDASTGFFPTTGGTGPGGTILKGNTFYVSVAGTLGGQVVNIGDVIRAHTAAPGQGAANWNILESNIGYVPANRAGDILGPSTINGQASFGGLAGAEAVRVNYTPSSINRVTITGSLTGVNVSIIAEGTDSNIGIDLLPKGGGKVNMGAININARSIGSVTSAGMGAVGGNLAGGLQLMGWGSGGDVTIYDRNGTARSTVSATGMNVTGALSVNGNVLLDTTNNVPLAVLKNAPYDISSGIAGKAVASDYAVAHLAIRSFTIPAGAGLARAYFDTAPTAAVTYNLQKGAVVIGTITFAANASVGTVSITAATSFIAGDVLKIYAPATADTTAANLSFTIAANLT